MWDELSAAIINVIAGSSKVDSSVAVFDYAKTNLSAYPCITVTPSDNTAQFGDTNRNQRSYIFSLRIYQERTKTGEKLSEQIMRQLADSLITLFDANPYLDNQRLSGRGFCRPIPSVWKYAQAEQIDVRVAEILLEAVVIQ